MNLNLDLDDEIDPRDEPLEEESDEIDWDSLLKEADEAEAPSHETTSEIDLDSFEDNGADEEPNEEPIRERAPLFSETKKTAFLAIGIGVVLLVIGLIIVSLATGKGSGKSAVAENTPDNTNTVENVNTADTNTASTNTVENTDNTMWVSVTETTKLKASKTGRFTIVDIKHYGANVENNLQTKTIAVGELKGYGTGYEMELPNSLASTLAEGDTITVKFKTGVVGNTVVIGDIESLSE